MSASRLLAELRHRGFVLRAVSDRLAVQPASRLDGDLRSSIRRHKPELLRLLTDPLARAEAALQPLMDGREIWDGDAGCGMPGEDGDAASVRLQERPAAPPLPSASASGGGTARTGAAGPESGRCRSSGRSVASSRCRVFHATSQSEMPIR